MRALGLSLMVLMLVSCSDATGPGAALFGRWSTAVHDMGADYSRAEALHFHADGVLEHEVRVFRSGRLESLSRYSYSYVVRDDSLFTSRGGPDILMNWTGTPFNRARIALDGATLRLTYPWSGPADEPITVTTTYFREACLGMAIARCL